MWDNFTHQLEEVGNNGEEQTGEHRTHRFGSLLYQCNGDLNSLQEKKQLKKHQYKRILDFLSQENEEAENDEKENTEDDCEGQPGITLLQKIFDDLRSYVQLQYQRLHYIKQDSSPSTWKNFS